MATRLRQLHRPRREASTFAILGDGVFVRCPGSDDGLARNAGQAVGSKGVHEDIWLVSFVDDDFGVLRPRYPSAGTTRQPVRPEVVTMQPVRSVARVSGSDLGTMVGPGRFELPT
jgi:hypothetical protein